MYHIRGGNKLKAYEISIELCNAPHNFEIDTGATRSIISEETYNQLRDKVELKSSRSVLSTYTGERISVAGAVMVPVKYQDQRYCLPAIVVKGPGPNLLGRDWLQVVKPNWQNIFKIQEENPQLQSILDAHGDLFSKGLGTLKGTTAKIYVDPEATPKVSGIRRHGYQVLWWKRQVQCQHKSSWTMVQSFDNIKTMFVSVKVQLQWCQLPVRYPRQHP